MSTLKNQNENDFFKSTAKYYAKYRDEYQLGLIQIIVDAFKLDGSEGLLDLGCGTGRISMLFHEYFSEIIGVDISDEMIKAAKVEAKRQQIKHIEWINMSAEKINNDLGKFKLITCGESFHWMNREKVLDICYDILVPNGGFVILGAGGAIAKGEGSWQQAVREVIEKWVGRKRKNSKWMQEKYKGHEEIMKESRFSLIKQGEIKYKKIYSLEEIVGFLYTTSYCNKALLGDRLLLFEEDLKNTLLRINSDGKFEEERVGNYLLGHKVQYNSYYRLS